MLSTQQPNKLNNSLKILILALGASQAFGCANVIKSTSVQTPTTSAPQEIVQVTEVRALPGKLDDTPVFNSNSPEWIKNVLNHL